MYEEGEDRRYRKPRYPGGSQLYVPVAEDIAIRVRQTERMRNSVEVVLETRDGAGIEEELVVRCGSMPEGLHWADRILAAMQRMQDMALPRGQSDESVEKGEQS